MRSPSAPLSIGLGVGLAIGLLLTFVVALPADQALSREADRTLRFYFGHTGEHGEFTFKRNGRYDRREIRKLNHFLRDWRKEEDADMDPQLLDLVWAIYRESGSRDEIHVVSAYRSPATNDMLRGRSSGVAKNSQHMLGKAIDWYVTDVPLAKLRGIAMKMQGGGVGYYPASGSPFIHTDTGSVRAWPRMSRQQLLALFPNGGTLHLPADGKPLPGYELAVAQRQSSGGTTTLAYLEVEPEEADGASTEERSGVGAWLRNVLPGGRDGKEPAAEEAPASEAPLVAATDEDEDLDSRVPRPRPGAVVELATAEAPSSPAVVTPADAQMIATLAFAPLPRTRPDPMFLAASLGGTESGTPLPMGGDTFVAPAAPAAEAANDPIALAFAAAEEDAELPSEGDAAIIAAFAALQSAAEQKRIVLAGAPEAAVEAPAAEEPRPVIIAAAMGGAGTAPRPAEDAGTDEPVAGIVLLPEETPAYAADQGQLQRLIAQPAAYDPQFSQLAMPVPSDASAIYRAPEAAGAVTAMSSPSALPVDRFAAAETAPDGSSEQGFFMRLFASLIE